MKELRGLKVYKLDGNFTLEVMGKVELAQRMRGLYTLSRMGRILASYSFSRFVPRKVVRRRILIARRERC